MLLLQGFFWEQLCSLRQFGASSLEEIKTTTSVPRNESFLTGVAQAALNLEHSEAGLMAEHILFCGAETLIVLRRRTGVNAGTFDGPHGLNG